MVKRITRPDSAQSSKDEGEIMVRFSHRNVRRFTVKTVQEEDVFAEKSGPKTPEMSEEDKAKGE